MFPTTEMTAKLVHMHCRVPSGKITTREHLLRDPLHENTNGVFNSAGAGYFVQPNEYTEIIATLFNGGTFLTKGKRILKKKTVNEIFSNQIRDMPNFGRQEI